MRFAAEGIDRSFVGIQGRLAALGDRADGGVGRPALRASCSCTNHSCWQLQRRAVTSTASSTRLRRQLALPAQVLAERLEVARERRVMDERDERSAHLAARTGGDQRRDLALVRRHLFGGQAWKSAGIWVVPCCPHDRRRDPRRPLRDRSFHRRRPGRRLDRRGARLALDPQPVVSLCAPRRHRLRRRRGAARHGLPAHRMGGRCCAAARGPSLSSAAGCARCCSTTRRSGSSRRPTSRGRSLRWLTLRLVPPRRRAALKTSSRIGPASRRGRAAARETRSR